MKDKLPLVECDCVAGTDIRIGTPEFAKWLKGKKSFRYKRDDWESFTVRNRSKNYWYAYRQQNNKLRQEYLGKVDDLTVELFLKIAELISLPEEGYQKAREQRKAEKTCTNENVQYPSPTAEALEIEKLRSELNDVLEAIGELVDQVEAKSKGFTANSCSGGIKSILQLKRFLKTEQVR